MPKKTTKRILVTIMALLMLIGSSAMPASVGAAATADGFSYTIENGTVTITDYIGERGKYFVINIPSSINGVTVAKIGEAAFQDCYWITSVSIPASVKSIGEKAFNNCRSLVTVILEEGLWSIGPSAFYGCENLVNITLPDSLDSIDRGAFSDCTSLSNITIPRYVTSLNSRAFKGCTSLKNLSIHPQNASYTAIDNVIYTKDMWMLVSYPEAKDDWQYVIPDGVVSLAEYAFAGCTELVDVIFPDSLKYINTGAFSSCSNLVNPILSEKLDYIGNRAFYGCSGINEIEIPDSVTSIDTEAFYRCNNLRKIFLPTHTIQYGSTPFEYILDQQTFYRYTDAETGVVVPADVKDAELTVTEITDAEIIASYDEALADKAVLKAYEIKLTKNSSDADVRYPYVRIPTEVQDATGYALTAEGILSEKDTVHKNGYAQFRVNDLGVVVLAGDTEIPTEPTTVPDASTEPTEPTSSVPETSVDPTEPGTTAPGTSTVPDASTAPGNDYSLGDVNLDNNVNVKDATAIQKHIASLIVLEDIALDLADYDRDTKITVKDATAIQKFIAGIL